MPPIVSLAERPSPMPSPGDHLRMLVELMQPATPELARRWLAALLLVPREEREAVVASVEARIHELYPMHAARAEVEVVHPPVQRDGYVEEVRTTYAAEVEAKPVRKKRKKQA